MPVIGFIKSQRSQAASISLYCDHWYLQFFQHVQYEGAYIAHLRVLVGSDRFREAAIMASADLQD